MTDDQHQFIDIDEDEYDIVTPDQSSDDSAVEDSPVERMKRNLPEKLRRTFTIVDDTHPLVQTAGSTDALLSKTPVEVQKILTGDLYQDPSAFFREWKQNHVAAVVREAKRRVAEKLGRRALYYMVEHEHEALSKKKAILLPKSAFDILDMARDLGYHPAIDFEVDHDAGMLITQDNGIGMTTGEAITVWNEPAESGSGTDQSTAGAKGIGSLTWVTIAGEEGAIAVTTKTLRTETASGSHVPVRDRRGYKFYTFFGGIIPIPGAVPDGFFGTKFEIPVKKGLEMHEFEEMMERYVEILPVQIQWYETENGVTTEDEFEVKGILDRYSQEPALVIDRPGEFTLILDTPEVVEKGGRHNDTWLLDNPIRRNLEWDYDVYDGWNQKLKTLWNDHLVIHNEQGLIIAGPNRGKRVRDVDELYGEKEWIVDPNKPMPDVPMPEPVASRDSLKRGEAHQRFMVYLNHIAVQAELRQVTDYVNDYLKTDTIEDALTYLREKGTQYELFRKLAQQHGSHAVTAHATRLYEWLAEHDDFDFEDTAPRTRPETIRDQQGYSMETPVGPLLEDQYVPSTHRHEKWGHLDLLTKMTDEVSAYLPGSTGNPNAKSNRKGLRLGTAVCSRGLWPVFIGATLNRDRVEVIRKTFPNALIMKPRHGYATWTTPPWNARLVKDVPLTWDKNEDGEYTIPVEIHQKHSKKAGQTTSGTADSGPPETVLDRSLKFRTEEGAGVDLRTTVADVQRALENTRFGHNIETPSDTPPEERVNLLNKYIVVFPTNSVFNISDYWHLTGHAALVRTNVEETNALMRYPQVFTPDTFTRMLMDSPMPSYNPFTGEYETLTAMDVIDPDQKDILNVFVAKGDDSLINVITGTPDPDDDLLPNGGAFEVCRERMLEYIATQLHVKNPLRSDLYENRREWRIIMVDKHDESFKRAWTFWKIYAPWDSWKKQDITSTNRATGLRTQVTSNAFPGDKTYLHDFGQIAERAQYPQWDHDSSAWDRVIGKGYSGRDEHEKAIWWAFREIGIDPYTHKPRHLRRALAELLGGAYTREADRATPGLALHYALRDLGIDPYTHTPEHLHAALKWLVEDPYTVPADRQPEVTEE